MSNMEQNLLMGCNHIHQYGPQVRVHALIPIEVIDDEPALVEELQTWIALDEQGHPISLQDRDATLVAVSEQLYRDEKLDAALVSDDEALLAWQEYFVAEQRVAALPLHALQLLGDMVTCGAIEVETFLQAAEIEDAHYETLHALDATIERKRRRIRRLTTAVGSVSAKHV